MELREYMSIRRAYNLVRQEAPAEERLTFEEYAILAHLYNAEGTLKTSAIAEYQGVLRPTMTHRTNHLSQLGFITRKEGEEDRRNVCCALSTQGELELFKISEGVCNSIPKGYPLQRINAARVVNYVDAMGGFFCTAGDLSILGLDLLGGKTDTITSLVDTLGLLQPTVSMSIGLLNRDGFVKRSRNVETTARTVSIELSEAGEKRADELKEVISELVVRRHRVKNN